MTIVDRSGFRTIGWPLAVVTTMASLAPVSGQTRSTPPAQTPPAIEQQTPGRQGPSFRTSIDLVSLNVTVVDAASRYVTDLTQDDFSVFEDGAKQNVTFFTSTNLPIVLSLLLDTSASMESKLSTAQEAAIGFAKRLRRQDLAQVIDFDSRVTILASFTNDATDLEQAIHKTSAGGSTSLYNALYISLKEFKKVVIKNTDEIRREAIVLLSDGEDTSSLLQFEELLDLARRSETAIYSIGLGSGQGRSTGSRGFREAEFVLRQISRETGGRVFFPNQVSDLASTYDLIADELSSRYTVGYTPRNPRRDGAWRRVVVRVNRPDVTARTKQGYFGPTSH